MNYTPSTFKSGTTDDDSLEKKYCSACDRKTGWGYAGGMNVCRRCYVGSAEFESTYIPITFPVYYCRDLVEKRRNRPTAFYKLN